MDLQETLTNLKEGIGIDLSTIKNQYGDKIVDKRLYFHNGQWLIWEINCWSSSAYGLGTCHCNSHDPATEHEIDRERALELLRKYIERHNRAEEKRLQEIAFLEAMIEASDVGKIRRRVEDALRKSEPKKIFEVATMLGVKIL